MWLFGGDAGWTGLTSGPELDKTLPTGFGLQDLQSGS